jgi:drug/metabolite transporter (DMT)-like permease
VPAPGGDRTAATLFAVCTLIIATNPIAVRFSDRELDPFWGACLRFALATAIFVVLSAALRLGPARGGALAGSVLFGALNYAGAVGLAYYGFVHVHAGIGQILFALVPLATLLLAVLQRQENLHARAVVGALLAVAGVALLTASPLAGSVPPLSLLALLVSMLCVSESAVLARRLPPLHPVQLNVVASATAALILLPVSLLSGESIALPQRATTWAALAFVVVVSSVLMFILYLLLLRRWVASRVAYIFVLAPPLTIALSAWLDNEHVNSELFLGGAVILAGVYVGALRPRAAPVPAVPAP